MREALVPSTSNNSVKIGGRPAPSVAQGTGMISTSVPKDFVIVEQAVTVPVGTISPPVICTSGGA